MLQVGIFVVVTAGALALFRALSGGRSADGEFRRRLVEEFRDTPAAVAQSALYKNLDDLNEEAEGTQPRGEEAPVPTGWRARADEFLRQAGAPIGVRRATGAVAGLAVVAGVVGLLSAGWAAGIAGLVAGAVAPIGVLVARRKARRDAYLRQLVGAFELMARVLRAGQSVSEAFRAAVDAFENPLADEFGRCLHQIEHGLRPESAFRELSRRAGIVELRMFVVAMAIQRQSGGNLSEILDRLASVIRTRLRIRQKIRALTAEGRLQSLTLTVLPVLTFGAMYALNRPYAELLLAQWRMLAVAVGCVAVGTLWIRNIMNFEG